MFDWAKNNIELYTAALVLLAILVCWMMCRENFSDLKDQVVPPSFAAAHTAVLADSIHRPRDGLTFVDLALEDQLLAPQYSA